MNYDCDLAVIGAGPAGLAAATMAANFGLQVMVFDEQASLGGQIYRNIEIVATERPDDFSLLGPEYQQGLTLTQAFWQSGAIYRPNSLVWEINQHGQLAVTDTRDSQILQAKRILLTCGALERPVPIPGWTLPGVMTAGAAQTLLKSSSLVPDVPTIIAGSGPLIYLIAWQLLRAGTPLQAILLTAQHYHKAFHHLPRALIANQYLRKGLRWRREIRRLGIPILPVKRLAAEGHDKLESVRFLCKGEHQRLSSELLLLHEGIVPNTQLTMLAGCEHSWDDLQHSWRVQLDPWGSTTIPGISIAGDGAGISGADAAPLSGRLAALQIAYQLGAIKLKKRSRLAYSERSWLNYHLRIRGFLDRLFEPTAEQRIPADNRTLVCRCEEVSAGELREAVRLGCTGPNQAKAFTRCGMGPCQGRLCGLTVTELIAAECGQSAAATGHYRVRPPLKPLPLQQLAKLQT